MKRVVFTLLIALALLHNVKAQGIGSFSNDFSMSHGSVQFGNSRGYKSEQPTDAFHIATFRA